nr:STAS domain-containing protein [Streptomyces sp. NBC_00899]
MSTSDNAPPHLPVITAVGDLDADTLHPLTAELQTAAATASGVILDVSGVTFGDSSFINLLMRTHQHTDLRVTGLGPPLDRLFRLIGVDAVLHIFPHHHRRPGRGAVGARLGTADRRLRRGRSRSPGPCPSRRAPVPGLHWTQPLP